MAIQQCTVACTLHYALNHGFNLFLQNMQQKENLIFSILISNEMQIWKIGEVLMPTAGTLGAKEGGRTFFLVLQERIFFLIFFYIFVSINSENLGLQLQPQQHPPLHWGMEIHTLKKYFNFQEISAFCIKVHIYLILVVHISNNYQTNSSGDGS